MTRTFPNRWATLFMDSFVVSYGFAYRDRDHLRRCILEHGQHFSGTGSEAVAELLDLLDRLPWSEVQDLLQRV